jgi:hypothetical protein
MVFARKSAHLHWSMWPCVGTSSGLTGSSSHDAPHSQCSAAPRHAPTHQAAALLLLLPLLLIALLSHQQPWST